MAKSGSTSPAALARAAAAALGPGAAPSRPAGEPGCGRRSGPGACGPTRACPPRGRWPPSSASPAGSWSRPTNSWRPRDTSLARRGSGTRVARPGRRPRRADGDAGGPHPVPPPLAGIDLFPGAPDLSLFPRRAWGRALRRALAELPDARLSYGEFAGTTELRVALAEHLGRVRAAAAEPDRVVVTAGYQQGLRLFCQLVRGRGGRRIAVEDPGYPVAGWTIEVRAARGRPGPDRRRRHRRRRPGRGGARRRRRHPRATRCRWARCWPRAGAGSWSPGRATAAP